MQIREKDLVRITAKKPSYPLSPRLQAYLEEHGRTVAQDLEYQELTCFREQIALYDQHGTDTMWQTVLYEPSDRARLEEKLKTIYAELKMEGNTAFLKHLFIDRIDFCEFGNSQPFRIRVVNKYNDNHDYYYVKKADASRVYGLELEHILSPNRINILIHRETLVEEHIAGIPGDIFIDGYLAPRARHPVNPIRVAKEFVKFNERCFAKLLGDMRSYNYVIVLTQDFDAPQYRVRAIDFDRQCHEGDLKIYIPQFYRENQPVVEMVWSQLSPDTIRQYQSEERSLMNRRAVSARVRLEALFQAVAEDMLAPEENVRSLARGLSRYHHDPGFETLTTMGKLTHRHLSKFLKREKAGSRPGEGMLA